MSSALAILKTFPDIFRQEICFQVNRRADVFEAQGGVFQRVWDQGDTESGSFNVNECQADAINRHRALGYHLGCQIVGAGEPEDHPVAVGLACGDLAEAIDVALDEVTTEAVAEAKGAFEVNAVAAPEFAQIGAAQRFGAGLEGKRGIVLARRRSGKHR